MKTLANIMTTTLQKIEATRNIIMASRQMRDGQVGSLVVGLVSLRDLVANLQEP